MEYEEKRLSTFVNWSGTISPLLLVTAGFHFVGPPDKVKCFKCNGIVMSWEYGDDPFIEHRRHFPHCPYVNNPENSGNIRFTFGRHVLPSRPATVETDSVSMPPSRPSYNPDDMNKEAKRLETLEYWPLKNRIDIGLTAKDGLYYVFEGDKLKCAFCDGAMINWDESDVPAEEHRKYFTDRCPFIKGHHTNNIPIGGALGAPRNTQYDALNIVIERPRHQNKATEEARMQSFCNWEFERVQSASILAKAGFFFTGKEIS